MTVQTDQLLAEIREANLSYLMLAQNLIRADRAQALYRLGVSEDTADLIAALSPAQMLKIASGNTWAVDTLSPASSPNTRISPTWPG